MKIITGKMGRTGKEVVENGLYEEFWVSKISKKHISLHENWRSYENKNGSAGFCSWAWGNNTNIQSGTSRNVEIDEINLDKSMKRKDKMWVNFQKIRMDDEKEWVIFDFWKMNLKK